MHWLKKTCLGVAVVTLLSGLGWQATKTRGHFLFLSSATLMDVGIMRPSTHHDPNLPVEYRVYAIKEPLSKMAVRIDGELAGKGFSRHDSEGLISWDQKAQRVVLEPKVTRESREPLVWSPGEQSSEWTRITIFNLAEKNVFTSIRAYFFAAN
jgi:hypothetical protein